MKIKSFYDLSWEYNQMLSMLNYAISDYNHCDFFNTEFRLYNNASNLNKLRYYLSPNCTVAEEKDDGMHD